MIDFPTWRGCFDALSPIAQGCAYYRLCLLLLRDPIADLPGARAQASALAQEMRPSGGLYQVRVMNGRCVCILHGGWQEQIDDRSRLLRDLVRFVEQARKKRPMFLACSALVDSPMWLERAYMQCRRGAEDLFFRGWGAWSVRRWDEPFAPFCFDFSLLGDYARALSQRDLPGAQAALERVFQAVSANREAAPERARGVYYALWSLAGAELSRWREVPRALNMEEAQAGETLAALRQMLARQTQALLEPPAGEAGCPAVSAVIRLIRENFADKDLTVRKLAEKVYLTPTYLAGIFKKSTGKTISQYLTEIRIEYSMNLLMDKQIKISTVAELAGYSDPNYLTKTFKSRVGLTPTEYRSRYGKR